MVLVHFQTNQAKEPIAAPESVIDDHVQSVTPENVVNLSTAGRQPANSTEELIVFMT